MDCILPHHVLSSRSELGGRGAVRYRICYGACLQLPGLCEHVCKRDILRCTYVEFLSGNINTLDLKFVFFENNILTQERLSAP